MIAPLNATDKPLPEFLNAMSMAELYGLSQDVLGVPEQAQMLVLKQILDHNRDTEYGRKHGFCRIVTSGDFQRQVPICEWGDVDPYADRMAAGEAGVLVPGMPKVFIATSGTTGNKPKLIPETEYGAMARNLVMKLRLLALNRLSPGILESGCILPLFNLLANKSTPGGTPICYASGFTLSQSMGGQQPFRLAFPLEILQAQDPAIRDYLLLRFAIQRSDVVLIAGNNAGRLTELIRFAEAHAASLIEDIGKGAVAGAGIADPVLLKAMAPALVADPERADALRRMVDSRGKLLPCDYWPSMKVLLFWLSSSVGRYIDDVKPLLPATTRYVDMGYGASEGKFNVPFEADNPAGALSTLTAFYEFIPEGGGVPRLAHQLEDGKSYELLITTWAGLYRYNLKDTVKVQGFTGRTPNIVFQYKSGEILNIAEEKIPAAMVADAFRRIASEMGIKTVQIQIFPSETERRYFCYLEPEAGHAAFDAGTLACRLHEQLGKDLLLYNLLVTRQNLIHPPAVIEMRAGWQPSLYAQKTGAGQSSTQVKLPVMIKEKPDSRWIR